MLRLAIIVLASVGLFASACSDSPEPVDASTLQTQLEAAFEAEGSENGGAVALMTIDGVTVTAAVGDANSDGDPLTVDHQFRVGSISKPVVAALVLQLAQEGLLNLSDPLVDHLPTTAVGGDVTVEQLLAHRSGIPDYLASADAPLDGPLDVRYTPDEVVDLVAGVEPNPGGGPFAYSNTNYILLGQVIEAVDGRSLNESLAARITDPLGLEATFFALPDWPAATNLAGGWAEVLVDGDPDAAYAGVETLAWAAGTLVSDLDDLATLLVALGDGRLLDEAAYMAMTDFEANPVYGLGVGEMFIGDDPAGAGWGHGGSIPGYRSLAIHAPESGDLVVVFTNTESVEVEPLAEAIVPIPLSFDNDPPAERGAAMDDGSQASGCVAELGVELGDDEFPRLDEFPDSTFGETMTAFFELLADGDQAARREFVSTKILTPEEIEEDATSVDDMTSFLGDLQAEYGDLTVVGIVEIDPLTYVVAVLREEGSEPDAWVLGSAPGEETSICNLCTGL